MRQKTPLRFTNEKLSKKFNNNFDLVNYAITLAKNMIASGRSTRAVHSKTDNRATQILDEIDQGKDQFDEIQEGMVRQAPSSFDGEQLKELMKEERTERKKQRFSEGDKD